MLRKYWLPALMLLALLFQVQLLPAEPVQARLKSQETSLEELWIDLRLGPPLIPLFNEISRPDDIGRVDHPNQLGQLKAISPAQKLIVFKSLAEAEDFVAENAAEIDILGYNLEHGQTTPPEELADPVASIQAMRDLADAHDLQLAFGPDHDLALSHGVQMAPYADYFVLQIQRQQTNPPVVTEFVVPLAPQLRAANPDLQISVQVRTEGDVPALIALLESLQPHIDGISILTSPETVETAETLLDALRPSAPPGGSAIEIYLPWVLGGRVD